MADPALTRFGLNIDSRRGAVVPVSSSPFYLNWEFWTVVMAALAIILSQLPPVVLWFRPKRLEKEARNRCP
jgi:hypothetical protein